MKTLTLSLSIVLISMNVVAACFGEKQVADSLIYLNALVLDGNTGKPLPYTNVYLIKQNKGVITNEKGRFAMEADTALADDSVRFQYIGYKTKNMAVHKVSKKRVIFMDEKIEDLNEMVVYGSAPDPEDVVEKVLENRDKNYKKSVNKCKVFIRRRYETRLRNLKLDYKKNNIAGLTPEMFKQVEQNYPRLTTSYTDFLGYIYANDHLPDSLQMKIEPIKAVSLKDKNIADMEQFTSFFEKEFAKTQNNEYWKVRSGVFSEKLDTGEKDSDEEKKKDSLKKQGWKLKFFAMSIKYRLRYTKLKDDDAWQFLHKTGRYNYELIGGTSVNGEDVYVIDFKPGFRGNYQGRMYISTTTYALVRADYQYAPGEDGTDFNMFGLEYVENKYKGSIYFEKKDNNYVLKYFSLKKGTFAGIERNIHLLKKRERFLFDKKEKQVKVGVKAAAQSDNSFEYYVLDTENISKTQFSNFQQQKYMNIIYVDQFDESLWSGYSIIEPTQQMKMYKKRR